MYVYIYIYIHIYIYIYIYVEREREKERERERERESCLEARCHGADHVVARVNFELRDEEYRNIQTLN